MRRYRDTPELRVEREIVRDLRVFGFVIERAQRRRVTCASCGSLLDPSTKQSPGIPDLGFIWPKEELILEIEVKAGKNTLSLAQELYIKTYNRAGGFGIVAYSSADVFHALTWFRPHLEFNLAGSPSPAIIQQFVRWWPELLPADFQAAMKGA